MSNTEQHFTCRLDMILAGEIPLHAEACDEIRQFARDFDWGPDPIQDPEHAADNAMGEIVQGLAEHNPDAEVNVKAAAKLRGALWASAERAQAGCR